MIALYVAFGIDISVAAALGWFARRTPPADLSSYCALVVIAALLSLAAALTLSGILHPSTLGRTPC